MVNNEPLLGLAAMYAKNYVVKLNKISMTKQNGPSDVGDFFLEMSSLVEDVADGSDDHLMFLSHFKAEAGTEATMLEEGFQRMVQANEYHSANHMKRPAFLDSADLEDLSLLRDEVIKSHN